MDVEAFALAAGLDDEKRQHGVVREMLPCAWRAPAAPTSLPSTPTMVHVAIAGLADNRHITSFDGKDTHTSGLCRVSRPASAACV